MSVSRGTVDQLLEMEWIRFGRRKMTPGRPVTFRGDADIPRSFRAGKRPRSAGAEGIALCRASGKPPAAGLDAAAGRRRRRRRRGNHQRRARTSFSRTDGPGRNPSIENSAFALIISRFDAMYTGRGRRGGRHERQSDHQHGCPDGNAQGDPFRGECGDGCGRQSRMNRRQNSQGQCTGHGRCLRSRSSRHCAACVVRALKIH